MSEAVIFTPKVTGAAKTVFIEELFPGVFDNEIHLTGLSYHRGGVRFEEILFLASIARHLNPTRIFEIGTCRGRTTVNLARNCPRLERLYTLNLPPDAKSSITPEWHEQDKKLYGETREIIGERFAGYPGGNIVQLYGDSMTFDYAPYKGVDVVFIDANKSYQHTVSDSKSGLSIVKPKGTLIWHDYNYADDVTRGVDDFARSNGLTLHTIHKSTIAVVKL